MNQMAVQKSLGGAAAKTLPGAKSRTQLLFLDDLNYAGADAFGIQSSLELLRQILSQGTLMSHIWRTKLVEAWFSPATQAQWYAQAQTRECLFHRENGIDISTSTRIKIFPFFVLAPVLVSRSFSFDVKLPTLSLCLRRFRVHLT